jgi:Fungal specific transcription factor domain/Fungal Zn(2)-Cys(6) binuclear cluster domain
MAPKPPPAEASPKGSVRACQFCRVRKIKCDTKKPTCGSCIANNKSCVYVNEPPKKRCVAFINLDLCGTYSFRPSKAIIASINKEKRKFEQFIISLKNANPKDRAKLLESAQVQNGNVQLPGNGEAPELNEARTSSLNTANELTGGLVSPSEHGKELGDVTSEDESMSQDDLDTHPIVPVPGTAGQSLLDPPDRLHRSILAAQGGPEESPEYCRTHLIAQAALQLQREHSLRQLNEIRGVPTDLALHLLDLHWNRQHHTFHLTYRPVLMRELVSGGPYCSDFLLNAVWACSSKFSERIELRDDPADPESAGRRFFERCDQLLMEQSLLSFSSIPTIIGLLLLGSTFNARGFTSKGWLYLGYALRMVLDLGLHVDRKITLENAEEVEIRRRVFWGAFICEKLQSLYLGRPVAIQPRDAHVSRDFMDTFEELELWVPYIDPKAAEYSSWNLQVPAPMYSLSTFQQLCNLAIIMTKIMNQVYVSGGTVKNSGVRLEALDTQLSNWYRHLPPQLVFEPWSKQVPGGQRAAAPNVIVLLTTYHALIILLHRPFISNGALRRTTVPANSWKKCTAAARNITSLALAYQSAYPLRRANYLLSYAVYVASTIHVRNLAAENTANANPPRSSPLKASLKCLDELSMPNGGAADLAKIIRRLMEDNGIKDIPGKIL